MQVGATLLATAECVTEYALHVLQGFAMSSDYDITTATGWEKARAKDFAEYVRRMKQYALGSSSIQFFTFEEMIYLIKIIADTIKEIGAEFQTLTGYFPEEALQVGEGLARVLEEAEH